MSDSDQPHRIFNVLFLCTGNSARSILAESILAKDGTGRFRAFSAGSQPKGEVNPFALKVLRSLDYPADGFRSKSWEEFARPEAPVMDFVFTVCDNAAGEACPVWPGAPVVAHWGVDDPARAEGDEAQVRRAYQDALHRLRQRIQLRLSLKPEALERLAQQEQLREIGRTAG